MKYISILLLLFFSIYYLCYSQRYIRDFQPALDCNPDSVFSEFKMPKLPKYYLDRTSMIDNGILSLTAMCIVKVGRDNKCIDVKVIPFYNDFNEKQTSDNHLLEFVDSIKATAKQWILKPYLFKNDKIFESEYQKWIDSTNQKIQNNDYLHEKVIRPFAGMQNIILFLHYELIADVESPTEIIWINQR